MNKEQRAAYMREWHAKHKERRLAQNKKQREQRRSWLREYKTGKCCIRCGFSDPRALTFHHREPSDKSFQISEAASWGRSQKKILQEIEKCDLLCANCHMIEHASNE